MIQHSSGLEYSGGDGRPKYCCPVINDSTSLEKEVQREEEGGGGVARRIISKVALDKLDSIL